MAEIKNSRLSLNFVVGFTDEGEPIFKAKHYRNIDPQAGSEAVYDSAMALAGLQQHEVERVERSNTYELGL
ncbi:MAG: DUF1659 domain-containing protein [Bacillus sp. (in: Bacteria)]|nr:DUF1659 domain-containing protein [Bacillus sp. (in: firmicutes)]